MNTNDLVKWIVMREGRKRAISIAQVREVLGIIADICFWQPQALGTIVKLGQARAARRRKKGSS